MDNFTISVIFFAIAEYIILKYLVPIKYSWGIGISLFILAVLSGVVIYFVTEISVIFSFLFTGFIIGPWAMGWGIGGRDINK